jgi:NADH-quinone oxidoreductase subunit H
MLNIPEGLDWLATNQPAVLALIRVLLFVVPILIIVPGCIWWERRLLSWMQDRIGPNRTGTISKNFPIKFLRGKKTFGLLQPIADGVKLFFKEDVTPSTVDRVIYFVAPAVALFPAFAVGGTLPWGPTTGVYGHLTPIWNPEIGLLFMLAISSLGVYGVVLGGYASNNKYSLLGGLRSSAQLISYELAMSMALACIVLPVGSLRMTEIITAQ